MGHKKSASLKRCKEQKTAHHLSTGRGTRTSIYLNISLYTYHYLYTYPFYAVSSILLSCIFHNISYSRMAPVSHLFLHKLSLQIACSWQTSLSTLPPYKSDQICQYVVHFVVLIESTLDMGVLLHPKLLPFK